MGNRSSSGLTEAMIATIEDETGFSSKQIKKLYHHFHILDKDKDERLMKDDIRNIPDLHKNPLLEHVVHAVFKSSNDGSYLTFPEFARVMATFRPIKKSKEEAVNSREAKLKFAFSMYDFDDTGYISRDEILDMLHMMVGANVSGEQLESICDRTIIEADKDGDGKISFQEFQDVLEKAEIEIKMSIHYD